MASYGPISDIVPLNFPPQPNSYNTILNNITNNYLSETTHKKILSNLDLTPDNSNFLKILRMSSKSSASSSSSSSKQQYNQQNNYFEGQILWAKARNNSTSCQLILRDQNDNYYFMEKNDSNPSTHQNFRPFTNVGFVPYDSESKMPEPTNPDLINRISYLSQHLNNPELKVLPLKKVSLVLRPTIGLRYVQAMMVTNPKPKWPNDRALLITEFNPCNPDNSRPFHISIRTSAENMRFPVGALVKTQLVAKAPVNLASGAVGVLYPSATAILDNGTPDEDLIKNMRGIVPDELTDDLTEKDCHNVYIGGFTKDGASTSTSNSFDFLDCEKAFMGVAQLREFPLSKMISLLVERATDNRIKATEIRKAYESNEQATKESLTIFKEDEKAAKKLEKVFEPLNFGPSNSNSKNKIKINLVINLIPWLTNFGNNPNGRFSELDVHHWISTFRREGAKTSAFYEIINITPSYNYTDETNFNLSHSLLQHLTQHDYDPYLQKVEVVSNLLHLGATHGLTGELQFGMSRWLVRACLFRYGQVTSPNPRDFPESGAKWSHTVVRRDIKSLQEAIDDNASSRSVEDRPLYDSEVLLVYATNFKGAHRRAGIHMAPYTKFAYPDKIQIPYNKSWVVELPSADKARDIVEKNQIEQNGFVSGMLRQDFHSEEGFLVHFRNKFCVPSLIGKIAPDSACVPAGRLSYKVIAHPSHPLTIQTLLDRMKNFNATCVVARKAVPFAGVEDKTGVYMLQRAQSSRSGWHFRAGPDPSYSALRFIPPHSNTLVIGADVAPSQRLPILVGLGAFLKQYYPNTSILTALLVYDSVGYRSFAIKFNNPNTVDEIATLPSHVREALVKVGLPRNCLLTVRDDSNFPIDGPAIDVGTGKMREEDLELPENDYFVTKEHAAYLELADQMLFSQIDAEDPGMAAAVAPNLPLPPPRGGVAADAENELAPNAAEAEGAGIQPDNVTQEGLPPSNPNQAAVDHDFPKPGSSPPKNKTDNLKMTK